MAAATPIRTVVSGADVKVHKWILTNADATGAAVVAPQGNDKSISVAGTFGGATVTIQGSLDPAAAAYQTLHDPEGNNLAFTAAGCQAVRENVYLLRPVLSGGAGSTITVFMLQHGR